MTGSILVEQRDLIIAEYPALVAASYARMFEEATEVSRLGYLGTLPVVLYYCTGILLQDYWRLKLSDVGVAKALSALVKGRPVEGKWRDLLRMLARAQAGSGSPFVRELVEIFAPKSNRAQECLDELIRRRNRLGHGTPPPAEEAARDAEAMRALFTEFLLLNDWMRRYRLEWRPIGGALPPADDAIDLSGKGALAQLAPLLDGRLYLVSPDRAHAMSLGPFLIFAVCEPCRGAPHETNSEVLVYQDLVAREIAFRGTFHERTIESGGLMQELKQIITGISTETIDFTSKNPEQFFRDQAAETTAHALADLEESRKYLADTYVEPPEWGARVEAFLTDERPGLVLSATAGSGKTCLMANTAETLRARGYLAVLWLARSLPNPRLERSMEQLFGGPDGHGLDAILDFIDERIPAPAGDVSQARVVILVDALNESESVADSLQSVADLLARLGRRTQRSVKVIVSIRDYALGDYADILNACRATLFTVGSAKGSGLSDLPTVPLLPFTDEQVLNLFGLYQREFGFVGDFHTLVESTQRLLRHPLMLRMTAETWAESASPGPLTAATILGQYKRKRLKAYGADRDKLEESLEVCAELVFDQQTLSPPCKLLFKRLREKFPDEQEYYRLFRTLWDEGFITRTRTLSERAEKDSFSFTFEGFAEYVLGDRVFPGIEVDVGFAGLFERVDDAAEFLPAATGALRFYLGQLLEDRSDQRGVKAVRAAMRYGGTYIPRIVGTLLGALEAEGMTDAADVILAELTRKGATNGLGVLRAAMETAFDTGDDERLLALGMRHLALLGEQGDEVQRAWCLSWLGDVAYNRMDDYAEAESRLEQAVGLLEQAGNRDALVQAKYFLARVVSDSGDLDRAMRIGLDCLLMCGGATPADLRGRGLGHFLIYMTEGDAKGLFDQPVDLHGAGPAWTPRQHLREARRIFEQLNDRRAIGRLAANEVVVAMCTSKDLDDALRASKIALALTQKAGDIQARAYALVNDAAVRIQKANCLPDSVRLALMSEARASLTGAQMLFQITDEAYVETMRKANEAVMLIMEGKTDTARVLLAEVVDEARDASDFFNEFDACVLTAGLLDEDAAALRKLESRAVEEEYVQGHLHVLRHLHRLAGTDEERNGWEQKAREVDAALGWNLDPSESIYMGFYAGLYL